MLLIVILGVLASLVDFVSIPAQQWFAATPHTLRVDELRNSAGNIGSSTHAPLPQPAVAAKEESAPAMILDATRGAVLSSVTVIILTLFLLAGGPSMLAR